mgnify:CR=1 FL=1
MVTNGYAKSRERATNMAKQLRRVGLRHAIDDTLPFVDEHVFYQFVEVCALHLFGEA